MAPVKADGKENKSDWLKKKEEYDCKENLWSCIMKKVQARKDNKLASNKAVLVLGDNGAGKTTLVVKLEDDLDLIYSTCIYESAWNRFSPSPWCSVFSEEEMEVMEFSRDLKYYWVDGYGYDINFQQACPIMEDVFKHLSSEDGPTSVFYFTHSGTLLKLLSHLGLYYDEVKLTHDRSNRHRLWKVGYMDAFGSNLAFVTFQCGDQLKLLTLHQERPVKLPGCPKEGLCSFDKIKKTYKESFRNCNFEEICKI